MYSYSLVLQNLKCLLALCLFRDLSKFAIITITNNQYSISNTLLLIVWQEKRQTLKAPNIS